MKDTQADDPAPGSDRDFGKKGQRGHCVHCMMCVIAETCRWRDAGSLFALRPCVVNRRIAAVHLFCGTCR